MHRPHIILHFNSLIASVKRTLTWEQFCGCCSPQTEYHNPLVSHIVTSISSTTRSRLIHSFSIQDSNRKFRISIRPMGQPCRCYADSDKFWYKNISSWAFPLVIVFQPKNLATIWTEKNYTSATSKPLETKQQSIELGRNMWQTCPATKSWNSGNGCKQA